MQLFAEVFVSDVGETKNPTSCGNLSYNLDSLLEAIPLPVPAPPD